MPLIFTQNGIDGDVDRTTFHDDYEFRNNYPMNVAGRTGISGRGEMKRLGVNHAALPVLLND